MAITAGAFGNARFALLYWFSSTPPPVIEGDPEDGGINVQPPSPPVIKAGLLAPTYVLDETALWLSDVSADLVADPTYEAEELLGKTAARNATTGVLTLSCDDVVFDGTGGTGLDATIRYAVFYADTGDETTSPLLGYWDLGEDVQNAGSNFTLEVGASGLLTVTPEP